MSELMLPRPENVRGRFGTFVTHDVFHVAERLQQVDPNLFVQSLDPPVHRGDQIMHFSIVEYTPRMDPPEQMVYLTGALDGRVIEHVEYLRRVPLSKRLDIIERMEAQREKEEMERRLDEVYENMGRRMWYELDRNGFNSGRGVSYPKRGVVLHGARHTD